jgi:hypothetical protein
VPPSHSLVIQSPIANKDTDNGVKKEEGSVPYSSGIQNTGGDPVSITESASIREDEMACNSRGIEKEGDHQPSLNQEGTPYSSGIEEEEKEAVLHSSGIQEEETENGVLYSSGIREEKEDGVLQEDAHDCSDIQGEKKGVDTVAQLSVRSLPIVPWVLRRKSRVLYTSVGFRRL